MHFIIDHLRSEKARQNWTTRETHAEACRAAADILDCLTLISDLPDGGYAVNQTEHLREATEIAKIQLRLRRAIDALREVAGRGHTHPSTDIILDLHAVLEVARNHYVIQMGTETERLLIEAVGEKNYRQRKYSSEQLLECCEKSAAKPENIYFGFVAENVAFANYIVADTIHESLMGATADALTRFAGQQAQILIDQMQGMHPDAINKQVRKNLIRRIDQELPQLAGMDLKVTLKGPGGEVMEITRPVDVAPGTPVTGKEDMN